MKIDKEELQRALTIVKPGLSSKEIIEQTTSFAFTNGRVITYNDEISISHPIEGTEFEGVVKAEELYGLLGKLNKKEIELNLEGGELQITSGRMNAGIHIEEKIQLPIREPAGKWKVIPDPEKFTQFIFLASQTCSGDMTQPKLTCVYVKKNGQIIGSDGFRLVQCITEKLPIEDFLISASSVIDLVKINPTHIQMEDGWIHFKNKEGTYFSCRSVDMDYIDQVTIDGILKVKGGGTVEFPVKIIEILNRVKLFAKRQFYFDEVIEVTIEGGKITLKSETEETKSWIKEKATIKYDGSLSFMITPTLFEGILKETRTCSINKANTSVKFKMGDDSSGWEYIVMLA